VITILASLKKLSSLLIHSKHIIFVLFFFISASYAQAQTSVADSLIGALQRTNNDRIKLLITNRLSTVLAKNFPQEAFKYAKQARELAKKTDNPYQLATAYQNLAEIYQVFGEYSKGLEYALEGLGIAEEKKYDTLTIRLLDKVALFNFHLGEHDATYRRKVLEYRFKAISLSEKINANQELAQLYLHLADFYRKEEKLDSALFYVEKTFYLAQKFENINNKGLALMTKGQIYIHQNRHLEALPFLSSAYKYLISIDNRYDAAATLLLTGIVYREKNRFEKAFDLFRDALMLYQQLGSKADIAEAYKQLYLTAERVGNSSIAFDYYKMYHTYKDSVLNESMSRQIAGMQSIHDAESKDKEIELLKKNEQMQEENLKQQRYLNIFLSISFLLICLIAFILYRGIKNKNRINRLLEKKNLEILYQQEEINSQKESIALQNAQLEHKNQELSFLNEEKNHLIGIVAHDLRNPLSQIKGLVNVLQMGENEVTLEEKEEYIRLIKGAIERMTLMINKTLDVNAIESQKVNLQREDINISAVMESVAIDFKDSAKAKNIEIIKDLAPQVIVPNLDRNYLTQIFENLVSNAIKYSFADKKIFLRVYKHENTARVEVQDQGQGISEEDRKKMFGKFQQLSAKPTQGEKSIGLGLSIVKKYVEAMGGKVWCESEMNKGANFIVEFKLKT
jgi:signal transduction histidine kinase